MVESKKKAGANARVYEVTSPDGKRVLVRAASPAQALRHVVEEDKFRVEVVNAIDVVDYVASGGVVQDATAKAAPAVAATDSPATRLRELASESAAEVTP